MLFTVYRKPGLTPGRGQNIYNCDYDRPPNENQVCDVNVKDWFPCTQENNFNYHKSAPCVFIKLNKVIDFTTNRKKFYSFCSYVFCRNQTCLLLGRNYMLCWNFGYIILHVIISVEECPWEATEAKRFLGSQEIL